MKKLYFLFTFLISVASFAQTTVFINELHYDNASSDVDEAIEIAGPAGTNLTGWTIEKYNGSDSSSYGTESLSGTIPDQQAGYGTLNFIFAANALQNGSPDAVALVDDMGTVIQFLSYEGVITAADGPAVGMTSTDIGVAETSSTAIGESLQLVGTGDVYEEFTWATTMANTYGAINTGQTFTAVNTPSLTITAPSDGAIFDPGTSSVTLSISVQNFNVAAGGTGDGYIVWTIDSGSGDVSQPDKFDTNDESIPVSNGGSYFIIMDLVDNGGTPIGVTATVGFDVSASTQVANITALISDVNMNGAGNYYEITGSSLVTHTDSYQNRKWIQDATISGILIYDSAGTISTTYNVGDMVSGLTGYTEISNGVLRFIPTSDTGSVDSSGNAVVPQLVTISDLNANPDMYESELIELQNVSFVDGDGVNVFSTGSNYDVTDGSNTVVKRTDFFGADYIGELIPSGNIYSLTAISGEYNGTAQIYVRSLADFTLSNRGFETSSFNLYPNPTSTGSVNIVSTNSAPIQVKVFDILGKQVKNETINSTLNVSGLKSGIYILNITQEGHSVTKKLVID